MTPLEKELREALQSPVHFDAITRRVYSVDASIFEVEPLGVVIPKDKNDLSVALEIAHRCGVPVTVRGAATGIAGGCLGRGLIFDLSKSLNRILEIDIVRGYALCEPGVVQDDLNKKLAPSGYRLGPDTSTGNRATLGGMLANNSAGARSLRFGTMADHVQKVELLLADGQFLTLGSVSSEEWQSKNQQDSKEGEIYRTLWEIKERDAGAIAKHFPHIPRCVSGYNLREFIKPSPHNIAALIAGSEGTLGIATQIQMRIVQKPQVAALLLIFFSDLLEALAHVPELLAHHPQAIELIDDQIIALGRATPAFRSRLDWLKGDPKAILIVEFEGESSQVAEEKINSLVSLLEQKKIGNHWELIASDAKMAEVWELRKSGLGILLSKRSYSRAIAFLEDISLPPLRLGAFMERFCQYLASRGKQAGIYGHAGAGCMHIRPFLNLQGGEELGLMRQMMEDISSLILEFGGALSGEHGDGLIRSWLNPKMFGEEIMQTFRQIKTAFDPLNLMNPGKIIPLTNEFESLRASGERVLESRKTFLDFSEEGGFELSADLCNGNGLCRKKEGLMCPSFQATNEEFHSTRARAQALRAVIHKRLPPEEFTGDGMHEVMDLCISCKGCKTQCPSQVDMAKFKSEFLYHYQEKHGYSWRSRLFAQIGALNSWMSPIAPLFNRLSRSSLVLKGLEKIGISTKRPLPALAPLRFSSWFKKYAQPPGLMRSVVLFNDTFTEFNHPQVGKACVRLLNALGWRVILPPWECCGRPALSKGFLPLASRQATRLVGSLLPFANKGYPIVGLEPSCLLTIKDDFAALLQRDAQLQEACKRVVAKAVTLDEFLAGLVEEGNFQLPFSTLEQNVLVHGHCYQKALVGMGPTLKVLRAVPGFSVKEIPSGCCGMAGSFGYEKEHEEISMRIGELQLFPSARAAGPNDWIIASGMSCRHQIRDGTGKKALHLAEALYEPLASF